MDPYMERHLHLADRRGLLQGKALSKVQEYAVELMMIAEERQKGRDFMDRLKVSVISHDPPYWLDRLYPQFTGKTEDESQAVSVSGVKEVVNDDDFDLSDTRGEWRFEPIDPKEAEEMLAEMLASQRSGGTVTAEELEDEGWV